MKVAYLLGVLAISWGASAALAAPNDAQNYTEYVVPEGDYLKFSDPSIPGYLSALMLDFSVDRSEAGQMIDDAVDKQVQRLIPAEQAQRTRIVSAAKLLVHEHLLGGFGEFTLTEQQKLAEYLRSEMTPFEINDLAEYAVDLDGGLMWLWFASEDTRLSYFPPSTDMEKALADTALFFEFRPQIFEALTRYRQQYRERLTQHISQRLPISLQFMADNLEAQMRYERLLDLGDFFASGPLSGDGGGSPLASLNRRTSRASFNKQRRSAAIRAIGAELEARKATQ